MENMYIETKKQNYTKLSKNLEVLTFLIFKLQESKCSSLLIWLHKEIKSGDGKMLTERRLNHEWMILVVDL